MPDISNGIRKANGKLIPFGIFKILRDSKKSKKLMMMLGGVKKEYRGKGLDVLMAVKIIQSAIEHRMDTVDSHLILENNIKMRSEFERIGCRVVKRFRIYQKEL
jgi:ribosomal protein S18 acetylase RimI-like enzyme